MSESDATPTPPPSTIGPDEVRKLIADGTDFVLIDVRNPKIFDKQGWTKEHGYPRVDMARFDEYLAHGYPVVEVPRPL